MSEVAGPIARILLRYVGPILMTKAGLSIDLNDPDLVQALTFFVGFACSASAEVWYYLARKYGWNT